MEQWEGGPLSPIEDPLDGDTKIDKFVKSIGGMPVYKPYVKPPKIKEPYVRPQWTKTPIDSFYRSLDRLYRRGFIGRFLALALTLMSLVFWIVVAGLLFYTTFSVGVWVAENVIFQIPLWATGILFFLLICFLGAVADFDE